MKKLSFDSTPTLRGFVFQFLVALDRCFEMRDGESVYIETFGDVSVLGGNDSTQIESKYYKRPLTDLDKNFWNTLHNWMKDDFPIERFSSLVLLTTQKVGIDSSWLNWNCKSLSERKTVLQSIKISFDIKTRKSKEIKAHLDHIFDNKRNDRLNDVIKKLYIDNLDKDAIQYYKDLQNKNKSIPKIQRARYVNELLGWVIQQKKSWVITSDDFDKEATELASKLIENTAVFPDKLSLGAIKREEYERNAFVGKIKNIEYDEVVPEAVVDYVHTALLIEHELKESLAIKSQYEVYEESLERRYRTEFRKASRNHKKEERMQRSKDLYDTVTSANDGTFHTYNSVPPYFHNGVMQILADEKDDIVWLLKEHEDE